MALTKARGISLHMSVQRLWMPDCNAVLATKSSAREGTLFMHGEDKYPTNSQEQDSREELAAGAHSAMQTSFPIHKQRFSCVKNNVWKDQQKGRKGRRRE